MAKMFYTMEEAQEKLKRSEGDIKQLVKDGLLREFRDGARIMFKVEEVDNLIDSSLTGTGTGEIQLAPEDGTDQFGMALSDTAEALGLSREALAEPGQADATEEIALSPTDTADQIGLEDTGQTEDKDDTVITSHGINVLDDSDQLEMVDPLAQTQIAPDLDDHVDIDSGSSGSGLLDLSREADDTSLGAELLEEIYPGANEGAVETQVPGSLEMAAEISHVAAAEAHAPPLVDYAALAPLEDPTSGAFGAMMVVPLLSLLLLGCVAAAQIAGVYPKFIAGLSGLVWPIIGGAAGLALVIVGVGNMIAGRPTKAAPSGSLEGTKPKKTKKEKKAKKDKKAENA